MTFRTVPGLLRLPLVALSILICSLSFVSCGLFGLAMSAGMVKLQYGCLPEGAMIDTPSGPVAVESLQTGDEVIGYEGQVTIVRQLHQYQEDGEQTRHLTVIFDGEREVSLSPRHRIGGISARDLKVGDQVAGHRVSGVRSLGGVTRSFDLLTDDAGYRIEGIPVNSMIREMAAASQP